VRNVVVFVLGGGQGKRLYPLTKYRSKPAVPLAGKYRLIDIPLSNCINSGLNRIYVLTQFMSVSLHRHIRQTYRFDPFDGGFVEILAAQQTMEQGTDWYEGTADAVRKNCRYLEQSGIEYVLILSGDQLYRMNFQEMLRTHEQAKADVTIAAIPVTRQHASGLGIMKTDDRGRVIGFVEKPQSAEELDQVRMNPAWIERHGIPGRGRDCLASMGIYLFNRDFLVKVLRDTTYEDFGKQIFPSLITPKHVQVHLFDGYWEDIGTIEAFYNANLALTTETPPFDLSVPEAPIYTRARFLPPSRFEGVQISRSLIADGCFVGPGTSIENSIVGLRCIIGRNVTIRDSIIMGADEYETGKQLRDDQDLHRPPIGIAEGTRIEHAIVDKNCRIGMNARIVNLHGVSNLPEKDGVAIRDGIPIVCKDSLVRNDWTF
jgi:glucose-1-phosphate adenylyltransferase